MKAFVQWLDYAVGAVIDQESGFWTKKPLDARLNQMLAVVEFDGDKVWVNDTVRKRAINVFVLSGVEWLQNPPPSKWIKVGYPKLIKKAPAWIHDPMAWQIRWANEVKNGRINEGNQRSAHA